MSAEPETVLVEQSRSRWDWFVDGRHLGCSVLRLSSRKDVRSGPIGLRSSAIREVSSLRCSHVEHRAVDENSNHSQSRAYDMRCPSRSGWGKASILSDQAGGRFYGNAMQAPDP